MKESYQDLCEVSPALFIVQEAGEEAEEFQPALQLLPLPLPLLLLPRLGPHMPLHLPRSLQ